MRRRIKKRVYVAIAILILTIVILCRACSAITKDHTNETNETRTTTTTSVTTSTAEAEEVKQVETADESKMEAAAKDEAETVEVEESSEAEKIMQFTVDDPDATELRAYLGERPANMQEIPTIIMLRLRKKPGRLISSELRMLPGMILEDFILKFR